MSKGSPVFGIDVSGWNDIEIADLPEWVGFVGIKATQSDDFVNPLFERQLRAARRKGVVVILYHFLDATAGAEAQAEHFLSTIEGSGPVVLSSDFESYGEWSPTNDLLRGFNRRIAKTGCPVWLYSGRGFWESGTPSGPFSGYNADVAWDANYADMGLHRDVRGYYSALLADGFGWGKRWGGVEPEVWQFTAGGLVAKRFVDFNAYRGTLDELKSMPRVPDTGRGEPRRPRRQPTIEEKVRMVLDYTEKTFGGPYVAWTGGRFTRSAPAWIGRHPAPPPSAVRAEGSFCAATAITLPLRRLGLPLPIPEDPEWEGGLLDYGNDFIDTLKIAEPYRQGMNVREGDLFIVRYTGPALADQGHTWIMGRNGKCYQSDLPIGINGLRTLPETIRFCGGKPVWIIRRERWMRPTR